MEVVWSKLALITYGKIFENLQFRWTVKEMRNFRDLTQNLLDKITRWIIPLKEST
jgi:two-component SAPR family response regulator